MTTTIEKEFRALTMAERVNLVEELWEKIASEPEKIPVAGWQIKELEHRRKLYRANPQRVIPWPKPRLRY